MAEFCLTAAAEQDLRTIRDHLAATSSVASARHVLGALVAAMSGLAEMPSKGHVREDLTAEPLRFWSVHQYLIIYRAEATPVEVVRVMDGRRDIANELR